MFSLIRPLFSFLRARSLLLVSVAVRRRTIQRVVFAALSLAWLNQMMKEFDLMLTVALLMIISGIAALLLVIWLNWDPLTLPSLLRERTGFLLRGHVERARGSISILRKGVTKFWRSCVTHIFEKSYWLVHAKKCKFGR